MTNWTVDSDATTTVETMLMSLAGVCDGAAQRDDVGFSGADVEFGHSLANRAAGGRAFTVKQATMALKLITKYRRQLGGKDFIENWIKNPVFKYQPLDPNAPVPVAQTVAIVNPTVVNDRKLTSHDKDAVFAFRFDAAIVAAVKTIRGEHKGRKFWASWDGSAKIWTVPVNETSISQIMEVAKRFGFDVEQRFKDYLAKLEEKTEESRIMLAINQGQHVTVADDSIIIAVDDPAILKEFEDVLLCA